MRIHRYLGPRGEWGLACLVVLGVACGAPAVSSGPITPTKVASASADDTAARVARIEHGLGPQVRVKGESQGSSIEDQLRAHHTPGVSLAIIHDYRVVFAKAYGIADTTTGARLTDTTLMSAASISKMVTALAALKEVEAGKIPLETNINETLKSWHIPENEFTRDAPVTLKNLLSHSAGTNVPSLSQQGEPPPTLLQVLEGKPPSLNRPVRVDFKPGSAFRYSGGGTTVVQQLLVDVEGGRSFPDIMNDVLLAPLKLSHSAFADRALVASRWPSVARGYDYDEKAVDESFHIWTGAAAGGLWTTPADLAQLLIEVQLGLRGRSKIISKEVASRLTTPILPVGGTISIAEGAFVEKHGDHGVYFGHEGLGLGFLAIARASATDGEGAVVIANSQAAGPLLFEILNSIAVEYAWDGWAMPPIEVAHVGLAHLAALSGRYGGEKQESVLIVANGDHLEARQPFRKVLELLPTSSETFICRENGTRFDFANAASGVSSLVQTAAPWPPGPPALTLTRLPNDAPLEALQLLESGRSGDALWLGKKLLAADPKDPELDDAYLRDIGEELLDGQAPEQSLPVLELNLALHPQSPMASLEVAEALFRSGRRAEALAPYVKAKSLRAENPTAMSERIDAYFVWRLFRLRALDVGAK
jgi:CubicO group peptidase (beta-lactamase class C family)